MSHLTSTNATFGNKAIHTFFERLMRPYSTTKMIEIAKRNKVLYQLGLLIPEIRSHPSWKEVAKRKVLQRRELIMFNTIAKDLNINYVVVKSFKFPGYVPDDIDVVIDPRSRNLINTLISKLIKNHGYMVRSRGTKELTIRKYDKSTYIDFDIHINMSAGPYVYIDNIFLFRPNNVRHVKIDEEKIPAPVEELDCLICIAHSILKEFELTLSDLLAYIHLCRKHSKVNAMAEELGLLRTTQIFRKIYSMVMNTIYIDKERDIMLPYKIPLSLVLQAYFENLRHQVKRRGISPLLEFISFPHSRGIRKLFDYLS